MSLSLVFSEAFVASYDAVSGPDAAAVNRMLDDLEERHGQPERRT